jgi:uncharacterized phage protein gp47/JayE
MIIPSLDELHTFLIADFYNTYRNDPNGLPDVSEFSFNWKWLRTFAAGVTGGNSNLSALISDLFPNTAEGTLLRQWATAKGLKIKSATGARKSKALRVFGTPTTLVPAEQVLTYVSKLRFTNKNSDIIGPGGYVDLDVAAIDVGSATRLNAGELLMFANSIAGISEEAKLVLSLDEDGADTESDGDLQARLAKRFSDPPRGGSIADYVAWALEVTGIASAYVYPIRRGWGTTHVAALHKGSGGARMLSAPEAADLQNVMNGKRPVGMRGFLVLNTNAEPVDVEHLYIPDGSADHEPDWDDTTPPTVTAWDPVTRIATLSVRPDSMKAGDRVTFSTGATGAERVIDALSGTDAILLTVDEDGDEPDIGDTVYAGGPLVQPVRSAILAHFATLGTANPDAKRYDKWEGNLDPSALDAAARTVTGVKRANTTTPSALVEASDPPFPDDLIVGLIIPGRVLVRVQH